MLKTDYPQERLDTLSNEALTAIEQDELKLLNWGFVDVRSPLEENLHVILDSLPHPVKQLWEEAQEWGIDPDDVLENLRDRKLVFRSQLRGQYYYRSRFAEAMRLLSLLRQRFSQEDWQTASRLVSDFKVDVKPRAYPRRDVPLEILLQDLRQRRAPALYLEGIASLLQDLQGNALQIARFQKDAILRHYDALRSGASSTSKERAIVVGAGTGAGKTKAFYVPALAEIASTLSQDRYVRAMAIYPRIELLKDQLVEALQEAGKLDDLLERAKPRKVILGAYYGDTPASAQMLLSGKTNWKYHQDKGGWECPFFSCPICRPIQRPLIWSKEDVLKEAGENSSNSSKSYGKYARLSCPNCNFTLSDKHLLLTRAQMINAPPDILFTTTEMLNRRLSKADEHHLFGCDLRDLPPPSMLLLDEIHTYEGLHGAQIAYLLRRWRHARRLSRYSETPLCCVGLSATLKEAESFFAKLTGIPKSLVSYISPSDEDLQVQGAEYNVVLKGDPVSGANLLSTSVQTVMLLARMLDISANEPSHGAYGQKIFAFTDKLDVINRWYPIELDAENTQRLSQYRLPLRTDSEDILRKKRLAGQDWSVCQYIGHELTRPLIIDRTSSQDRGVNPKAQLVVATSTLEVGFNDPAVGAVVQHKAPHSLASFVQRKGRAGRPHTMRPWMIVVTSAYGRDRWAFQHAENLFSPTLSNIDLPIENYYVRKMQATFAFMDWLSLKLKREQNCRWIDMWKVLGSENKGENLKDQRWHASQLITEVLVDPARRVELTQHIRLALGLRDQRDVDALLWDEPRSLLFEVLPTALRQLDSNWRSLLKGRAEEWADTVSSNPLPDFVTPNLFSDLKSFDIPLLVPPEPTTHHASAKGVKPMVQESREETLALFQCLVEFAPGNVNKRFAHSKSGAEAHWVPIPEGDFLQLGHLPVKDLEPSIKLEKFPPFQFTIQGKTYQFYTPRGYQLSQTPEKVRSTSSAQLVWKSHFGEQTSSQQVEEEYHNAEVVRLSLHSRWNKFFTKIRSYTQINGIGVEVARLAVGVRSETRYEGRKDARRLWLDFEDEGNPAGFGFVNYVDALQFQFLPLDIHRCLDHPQWPELQKALRPEYFRYQLRSHAAIRAARLTHFEIEWLWQLELSMLVWKAVEQQRTLREAAQEVGEARAELAEDTMKTIFQAQQAEDYGEEKVGRLHERLRHLLEEPDIQQALNESERALWEPEDAHFHEWLQQCYASSLGAALFATVTNLAPDIDPDDLHMDIDGQSIWISEAVPGGIGIISKIVDTLKTRPSEFDLQMQDTLFYCNRQQLDGQLRLVAELVGQDDQELHDILFQLRQEADNAEQQKMLEQLKGILERRGISATRDFVVALLSKFLRPNSSHDSDILISRLVNFWQQEEQRLGCVIDLRVIAVAALANREIDQRVRAVLGRIHSETLPERSQIFNVLQSLLWLPCTTSCPDCIEESHPFQELVKPSRPLLLALLQADERPIVFGQEQWLEQVRSDLETMYRVRVSCSQEQLSECKQQLLRLLVEPTDIGFQFFYPIIERVARVGKWWTVDMRVRELAYA